MRIIFLLFVLTIATTGCNKTDVCTDVICENGGFCNSDGFCDCPEGYSGFSCEVENTPSKMFIESIEITKFPSFEPDGDAWDTFSPEPDLTFEVARENQNSFYQHSTYFPDAVGSGTYIFDNLSIELTNVGTQRYVIGLFDFDDTSADDFMGGVVFLPYLSGNGFPEFMDLNPSGGTVAFKVKFRYAF